MSDQPKDQELPVPGSDTSSNAKPADTTPAEADAPAIEAETTTKPDTDASDTKPAVTDTKTPTTESTSDKADDDVEMTDAPATTTANDAADVAADDALNINPADIGDDPNDPDVDEDALNEDDDDDKLPAPKSKSKETSAAAEGDDEPKPAPPAPRKRGRPPGSKNKATLVRESEMEEDEEALKLTSFSAVGGFGPGGAGGAMRSGSARWAARGRGSRGGTSHLVMVPRDENGNPFPVEDDELLLPEDPAGEVKVNKLGELQGGREYRVRTFTVLGRGRRLYMLSTEPARCMGFRDSYLLFQKHRRLHKVIADEGEKFDLIERDIIPHSYKGRSIGIVTARSVFREFGAKIVLGGKKIIDDYYVQEAVDAGSVEGDIADPDDPFNQGREHSKDHYVAWLGGAGGAGAAAVPVVPIPPPMTQAPPKRRKVVGAQLAPNWMYDHALAASRFNSSLLEERREADPQGFTVEPLTGVRFVPQLTQPSVSEWFKVGRGKKTVVSEEMQFSPVTRTGLQVSFDLNDIDIDENIKEAILDQLEVEGTTNL
ncbi:Chromatin structure-remodeling complex subunit rsc7 [Yarrowia sp. C11]|nr:Chromatin structure-remodeling complex subunit rsc7 [Yarrowia sp. E02]KAG5371577.1 Chromatin structure-remodeling complex subunit rsc7 [Yarrowia sp. C11]